MTREIPRRRPAPPLIDVNGPAKGKSGSLMALRPCTGRPLHGQTAKKDAPGRARLETAHRPMAGHEV